MDTMQEGEDEQHRLGANGDCEKFHIFVLKNGHKCDSHLIVRAKSKDHALSIVEISRKYHGESIIVYSMEEFEKIFSDYKIFSFIFLNGTGSEKTCFIIGRNEAEVKQELKKRFCVSAIKSC